MVMQLKLHFAIRNVFHCIRKLKNMANYYDQIHVVHKIRLYSCEEEVVSLIDTVIQIRKLLVNVSGNSLS